MEEAVVAPTLRSLLPARHKTLRGDDKTPEITEKT